MLLATPGHQSKSYRLGLHSCPGTMASGYVQCMNYAEGLHFSAFHLLGIDACFECQTRVLDKHIHPAHVMPCKGAFTNCFSDSYCHYDAKF